MVRVLFVDDDPSVLDGLKQVLGAMPGELEPEFASGASKAIHMLEQGGFNALITDIRMPGMDGLALLRIAATRYPKMTRMVLSEYSEREPEVRSTQLAQHYFKKPCRFEELGTAIKSALAPEASEPEKKNGTGAWAVTAGVQALVPMFLERRRSDVGVFRRLLAENGFDKIRVMGHNMKGSATGYGFPQLSKLGAEIEQAAKSEDAQAVARQTASLEALLAEIGTAGCVMAEPVTN